MPKNLCVAIYNRIETSVKNWLPEKLRDFGLMGLAIVAGLLITVLGAIGLALDLPPNGNMHNFLEGENLVCIRDGWTKHGVWWLAVSFLLIDAALFVPVYGVLLMGLASRLRQRLPEKPLRSIAFCVAILLTLSCMVADEIENFQGLALLFPSSDWIRAPWATKAKEWLLRGALFAISFLFLWWFFALGETQPQRTSEPGSKSEPQAKSRPNSPAQLRIGVADIVWRTRYALIALALFAGLVLVMNQSRDVLVAVAQAFRSHQWFDAIAAMVLSAVAVWSFAYTCWMWSRILCRLRRPPSGRDTAVSADGSWPPGVYEFAKWWARLLGAAPVLMLVWLCGMAAGDAVRSNATFGAYVLLGFGAVSLIGAALFLWERQRDGTTSGLQSKDYFDCVGGPHDSGGELTNGRYRLLRILKSSPLTLPVVALVLIVALRAWNLFLPETPPLTLAIMCFAMSLWLGVIGLLSQLALRQARPYLGTLLVLVAILGWSGLTENHVVWTALNEPGSETRLGGMWLTQFLLAVFGLVAAWLAYRYWPLRRRLPTLVVVVLIALMFITPYVFDRISSRLLASENEPKPKINERDKLDAALESWLMKLCLAYPECAAGKVNGNSTPLVVYFVTAEGGGIRAAYWPALVLAELSQRDPEFDARTFALSGVSGGAVGVTVYRVCKTKHSDATSVTDCVRKFGKTDLLTPLLSAWMFEDVLARFLPTRWCQTPGCGVLSRGAWFEATMEEALPDLRNSLVESRPKQHHVPHLLLNSTWVETGERAIAADLLVEPCDFPTARDQITILGRDLPLSTAAHNASRFPFVNPLGSVKTADEQCLWKDKGSKDGDVCGHLADGGYFDNSGGHTTGDVLRALLQVLRKETTGKDKPTADQWTWIKARLVPQVIMLRNFGHPEGQAMQECSRSDPAEPRCADRFKLLTDLLGPLVAAASVIGTGSNGRLAEALLEKEVRAARVYNSSTGLPEAVVNVDLKENGVLYPLGWYLSRTARCGMEWQARKKSEAYVNLCAANDKECLFRMSRPDDKDASDDECSNKIRPRPERPLD